MLMFTKYKIFHIILSKLKGNSEEGDNVFDTARQNTTGHRTMAKKKGGHNRSSDPDSLLIKLILKTTGHNGYDERNSAKDIKLA